MEKYRYIVVAKDFRQKIENFALIEEGHDSCYRVRYDSRVSVILRAD